ncbi:MAG: hypothetical protein COA44_00660 [Arcobacter sp.]|nr:MAG: hypothetical protein COA44_00660 [Arcobacter sp.]
MREIGGYFEFEFDVRNELYTDATAKVNSGRNAIAYVLKASSTQKVYVPYFTCGTVIEPVITLGIEYVFYAINENLEIINLLPQDIKDNEKLIYINYFGIKNEYINKLAKMYGERLIIDNTQAFFKQPIKNTNNCYSPRKFFGVADGGYVYSSTKLDEELEFEMSYDRCAALLTRTENEASQAYSLYANHNKEMCHRPLKKMSVLTQKILSSIDYEKIKLRRERNFLYLHATFISINKLKIREGQIIGPMVYPLWIEKEGLRSFLIEQKIYVPTYWNEVLDYVETQEQVEASFVKYLLPIPIDQRYEIEDMQRIIDVVTVFLKEEI